MISRREALKIISVASGLLAGLPGVLSAKKYALKLDKAQKLKKVGGSALLKIKKREILFVRESAEVVRAIAPTCTHRKCIVEYDEKLNKIVCPCHGSQFDLDGKVLSGPAEEPLRTFEASLKGERIIFSMD